MNIIKIEDKEINNSVVQTVNARDLHTWLESKQDFSTWIKGRIEKYDFVDNEDFVRFHKKMEANNATMIEYHLTISMAKELSMVENNDKGKEARKYFIECEKRALNDRPVMTQAEIVLANAQRLVDIEREQNKQKYPMYLLDYRNTMVVVSGYSVENDVVFS